MAFEKARGLIEKIKTELAELDARIKNHAYITTVEQGDITREAMQGFAGHQYYVIGSDLRSIALLASRHSSDAGRRYLTGMFNGETAAVGAGLKFAATLGVDEAWLRAYEPRPGGVAYPHYVAWLAANGSDAELAAGFLVNLAAWGANCGRMSRALEEKYGFKPDELEFFTMFASPPPSFEDESLEVIEAGLEREVEPQRIARAARLLQSYELLYWDTMNEL